MKKYFLVQLVLSYVACPKLLCSECDLFSTLPGIGHALLSTNKEQNLINNFSSVHGSYAL